jgi:hypothetical protein
MQEAGRDRAAALADGDFITAEAWRLVQARAGFLLQQAQESVR